MEGDSEVVMDPGNPLLKAVFLRRLRLTRLLLEGGAYVNESDGQGQTPLMVACRTQHTDSQSASRVKLVQFLLEKGADPNIQDKDGRSALMHACREQAGPGVASLLLASGADVSLEDRSGTSALVYAVVAGDWRVLKLLLDTCKAKGKEVIIITTDKFPCGKLRAEQYLSTPPPGRPDQTVMPAAPASPSEIQLITSPQCAAATKPVFSFKETQSCGVSSHPCSPSRFRGLSQVTSSRLQQPLLRLNSEPWLKVPASLATKQPHESRQGPTGNSGLRVIKLDGGDNTTSTSDSFKWYEGKPPKDEGVEEDGRKDCMSLPGLISSHSASHPNLHSEKLGADSPNSSCPLSGGKNPGPPFHSMASSSLRSIIQRRKLGSDIYNSDPQLAVDFQNLPHLPESPKRLTPLRCSRESLLASGSGRRLPSAFERRGSGAFLLDHLCQAKPRSLPPLTLNSNNTPVLNVYDLSSSGGSESGLKHLIPSAPPGHPKEPTRRTLLRRYSMQTEQFETTA